MVDFPDTTRSIAHGGGDGHSDRVDAARMVDETRRNEMESIAEYGEHSAATQFPMVSERHRVVDLDATQSIRTNHGPRNPGVVEATAWSHTDGAPESSSHISGGDSAHNVRFLVVDHSSAENAKDVARELVLDALERIQKRDKYEIFARPVDPKAVPQYTDIIKEPMDFSTMREKLIQNEYTCLAQVTKDCDLIWSNCFTFNPEDSIFYQAAVVCKRTANQVWRRTKEKLLKMDHGARGYLYRFATRRVSTSQGRLAASHKRQRTQVSEASDSGTPLAASENSFDTRADLEHSVQQRYQTQSSTSTHAVANYSHASNESNFIPIVDEVDESVSSENPSSWKEVGNSRVVVSISSTKRNSVALPQRNRAPSQKTVQDQLELERLQSLRVYPPGSGGPLTSAPSSTVETPDKRRVVPSIVCDLVRIWPPEMIRLSSSLLILLESLSGDLKEWEEHWRGVRTDAPYVRRLLRDLTSTSAAPAYLTHRQALKLLPATTLPALAHKAVEQGATAVPTIETPSDNPQATVSSPDTALSSVDDEKRSIYRPNPCRPIHGRTTLPVQEYAKSMHRFVANMGTMANRIVSELLAPAIEGEQQASELETRKNEWQAVLCSNLSTKTAEWDQRCCRATQKAAQIKSEGEDADWLRDIVLDSQLAHDVENTPLNTVDFSTPFGVSGSDLRAVRDCMVRYSGERKHDDLTWIDEMIVRTERASSESLGRIARVDTSSAQRSSSIGLLTGGNDKSLNASLAGNDMKRTLTLTNLGAHASIGPREYSGRVVHGVLETSDGGFRGGSKSLRGGVSPSLAVCANCGTSDTPGWRQGQDSEQRLCNACGLFWVKYKRQRPPQLWRSGQRSTTK